jgi:phosphate starvation-inducible membrane PsiE
MKEDYENEISLALDYYNKYADIAALMRAITLTHTQLLDIIIISQLVK